MNLLIRKNLGVFAIIGILAITIGSVSFAQGKDFNTNLAFGDYFSVYSGRTMDETGSIEWAFTGSNTAVGITVIIMDEENYLKFENDDISAVGYIVSDGSYYSHSGTFAIPEIDSWYVVFLHVDLLAPLQTTDVDMTVNFIGGGLALAILIVIIVAPIVVVGGIIALVIVLVLKKKKQTA